MRYNNQVIYQTERDATLYNMSERLQQKNSAVSCHVFLDFDPNNPGNAPVPTLHCGNGPQTIGPLTRVYIVGHGDISCFNLAGKTGKQMANVFAPAFANGVGRVSLVSCFSANWSTAMVPAYGPKVLHNFAQQFHYWLGTADGARSTVVQTEVSARGSLVTVQPNGNKETGYFDASHVPQYQHKATDNKRVYYWKPDGTQGVGPDPHYAQSDDPMNLT